MKYIIFTSEGNGLPIAQRLIEEGNDVTVGFDLEIGDNKPCRVKLYDNMVEKVSAKTLIQQLKTVKNPQDYFLFFDSNELFPWASELQQYNFHGNFPTEENRRFELDRNLAKEFVATNYPKLTVGPKKMFAKVADAITFLQSQKSSWVVKSQKDAVATFVPDMDTAAADNAQVIDMLRSYQEDYEREGIFLEMKIPNLIEIALEKIYYDGTPISYSFDLENKYIGCGNLSFQVGCAGNLNFPMAIDSKLHDVAFPPIVDQIAKKHKGLFFWDAAILINGATQEMYFAEFCPNRPRYNQIFSYFSQMESVTHFFESLVQKKNPFTLGSVGTSISLFNLLTDGENEILSDASIVVNPKNTKDIWLYDAYKKKRNDSTARTVGYDETLALVTGGGASVQESVDAMYQSVEGIHMGQVYYRPKFDFLSKEYSTSLLNRLEYMVDKKLLTLPFSHR